LIKPFLRLQNVLISFKNNNIPGFWQSNFQIVPFGDAMDKLTFTRSPAVTIATNTFVNVPTILQYEDTPLIQVVKVQPAGFTMQIPIYHPDGTYLAKVVGSRPFMTRDGEKVGLSLT
jgi:hypothetical protein